MLAALYNAQFYDSRFRAETIHSAFRYPVDPSERPELNWDIGHYDFLVIDELSMVPTQIFEHIMKTLQQLHIRPVVLLCGDQQQQQPFKTVAGNTRPTQGVLQDKNLYKNSILVSFFNDPEFQEFLNVIKYENIE